MFRAAQPGTAQVRALRAGSVVSKSSRGGAAGRVVVAITVAKPGAYTFEVVLRGHTLRWQSCIATCRA